MRYLPALILLGLYGCAPAPTDHGLHKLSVSRFTLVKATTEPVMSATDVDPLEPERVDFEVRDTDLGNDHLGRRWAVSCMRQLGCDDWLAIFAVNGVEQTRMDVGTLKCGHNPWLRLEVWAKVSFIVVTRDSCWGTGVWAECERWYSLDRLDDADTDVLFLDVSGHVVGWGLAFDREFSASSQAAESLDVVVDVTGTLDVMWDEDPLFQSVRRASYRWDAGYGRFFPIDRVQDEAFRGMWHDGEDGLVEHSLADLSAWLRGPDGDPAFVQGLLFEAERDSTRDILRQLLASHG
jgi:hypothetical protein